MGTGFLWNVTFKRQASDRFVGKSSLSALGRQAQ
jgi:hypothetical protein